MVNRAFIAVLGMAMFLFQGSLEEIAHIGSKRETSRPIEKKLESGGGKTRVSGRRTLQERRSASDFQTPSQKGFGNLLPNATKPGEAEPLSC
jgi:hypothetical protein